MPSLSDSSLLFGTAKFASSSSLSESSRSDASASASSLFDSSSNSGICDPNTTTYYIEYRTSDFGDPLVFYYTLTGSLNSGVFTGAGFTLTWDELLGAWFLNDGSSTSDEPIGTTRCNPTGEYGYSGFWEATVSITPF